MTKLSINKLYIILRDGDSFPAQKLDAFLDFFLPHLSFTANVYIIASGVAEGVSLVERTQKRMKAFLKTHRFVRYNIHFLHPLPPEADGGDAEYFFQYYYQPWKRGSIDFEQEGFIHQEIPRLTLFTVVAPRGTAQLPFVARIAALLNEYGVLPSLYVQEATMALTQERDVTDRIKKIYYGSGATLTAEQIACDTSGQDLVEASCAAWLSATFSPAGSCGPALFMTAQDGRIYPCMNAFSKEASAANAYEENKTEAMVERCHEAREKEQNCLACRRHVFERFSSLPLPKNLSEKVEVVREYLHAL